MKLFCSNAVTGEDGAEVAERMQLVVDTLSAAGHESYCPVFDKHQEELVQRGKIKAVLRYDFENIQSREGVVVIVSSPRKSEGQLMEAGVALAAGKPLYVFWCSSVDEASSHLPKVADRFFRWQSDDDLRQALQQL